MAHEKFELLPLILMQERKLYKQRTFWEERFEKQQAIRKEEIAAIEQLSDFLEYYDLNIKMMDYSKLVHNKELEDLDGFEQLIRNPKLKNIEHAQSARSKILYLSIYGTYYECTKEHQKSLKCRENSLDVMEEHRFFMEEHPENYLIILNNIATAAKQGLQLKLYKNYIDRIGSFSIKKAPTDIQLLHFRLYYQHQLPYWCLVGEFDRCIEVLPIIQEGFDRWKGRLKQSTIRPFWYYFANAFYAEGEYEKALSYLEKAIDNKGDGFLVLVRESMLLQIIIHVELGNDLLVEPLVRAARRYWKKHEILGERENLMLNLLQKDERTKDLVLSTLNALKKLNLSPIYNNINERVWLQGLLDKHSYGVSYRNYIEGLNLE
ncbi:MAG: hypothetical protein GY810_20035 [Aureispira sp.]|nr:hypothetical protein [Aureispira sp.]